MEIGVGMGEIKTGKAPYRLKAIGLGSCVAVVLYDSDARVGSLGHIVLPCIEETNDRSQPARFADMAIGMMIDEMKRQGARTGCIWAKIFGGANMFPEIISSESNMDVGRKNILAVRAELKRYNVEIIAQDVGDHMGRTVLFDTKDGTVEVKTACKGAKKY